MLSAGTHLGPYEVLGLLGSGGMGEVYRAHDPRLGRDVAIKVLPADLSGDPDRLRRFEQEARAAGALNHPNVLAIHDVGTSNGSPYVVSELLGGETLRSRLRAGALPLREAVSHATQIARGLAAAHESGIVHRDLKPENLFLTRDRRIKILDFGLAKLTRRGPLVGGRDDTLTKELTTASGAVLGTVGYMSPEQVRGQAADHRSDIFALGAVFYEMLSGRRAFRGESPADTLTAILKDDPPEMSGTRREIPLVLERLTGRCLAKDPGERFQSASDLAFALGDLTDLVVAPAPVQTDGSPRATWRRWAPRLTALAVLAAGGAWMWRSGAPVAPLIARPLTSLAGAETHPALSPEGDRVAFAWNGGDHLDSDIYVTLIGPGRPLQLTDGPADDRAPVWSPDGQQLAFLRTAGEEGRSGVYVVPALGGAARRLSARGLELGSAASSPLSWSPDGKEIAIGRGPDGIALISLESATERRLTAPWAGASATYNVGDRDPAFSPDGTSVAFLRNTDLFIGDIHLVAAAGGEPTRLTFVEESIRGLDWTSDGRYVVFASGLPHGNRRLWRVPSAGGERRPLAVGGDTAEAPSVSRGRGRLAYASVPPWDSDIWRVDLVSPEGPGRSEAVLIASSRADQDVGISPDGRHIAFSSSRSGSREIWMCDADGSDLVQLTAFGTTLAGTPRWSPDGREIAFDARPEGHADIFVVPVEGGPPRRLTREESNDVVPSWSVDGRWVYFASSRTGTWQVFKVPADGGPATQVTHEGGFAPLESPDGRYVYYALGPAAAGLRRMPTDGGQESLVLEDLEPLYWGCWAPVDDGVYFVDPQTTSVRLLHLATGKTSTVARLGRRPSPYSPNFSVSPDRRWLLYVRAKPIDSDIILVDDFR